MVSAFDVSAFTGCHNGRRVYSNVVAATILRRRYPLELRRGMQRPSLLRPMIQVADSLQIGLRRTSRLGGGPLNENYQSLLANHISRCFPICVNLRPSAVGLCFASIRGAFPQESDRVRKNPREEPVTDYML